MKKIFYITVLYLGLLSTGIAQTVQTLTTTGTGIYTVPCGVTSIFVECWGGGGAGGGSSNGSPNGGSGGGGGGYCSSTLAVTPGQTIAFTVGAGLLGINGSAGPNGNPTTFATMTAGGGFGGGADGAAPGAGGVGSGGNVNNFTGGTGFTGNAAAGGGGGASASASGTGTSATGQAGAIALAGGGNGGAGSTTTTGVSGLIPGGGGGGAQGTNKRGGNGQRGQIRITYTPDANSGCDLCTAVPITTFPFVYTGNTTNFSNFLTGTCLGNYGVSGAANDMFFSLNIPSNNYYLTMSLTGTDPTTINELSILTAPSCSAGPFGCLSNGAWGGGLQTTGPNYGSTTADADSPCRTIYFPTAGTYYIAIDGNAGANGPFTLNVSEYSPTFGDNCTNAMGLSSGIPITITNTDCLYTMGPDDPTPSTLFCAGTVENTNWFHFQSDGSGTPVDVLVNAVSCDIGYFNGSAFYSASGQFGILTGGCSGPYSSVAAAPCASLATGASYNVSLPNTGVVDYYFVWDGNGGAECTYTITVTNVTPLPVELLNFEAIRKTNQVNLFWSTMTETNNDYFLIERSTDGINYSYVSQVDGNHNSNRLLDYKAYDFSPLDEITYYRLSQVDFDGRKENLKVVTVGSKPNASLNFSVYPNPSLVSDEVVISASGIESRELHLNVYDIAGKLISNQTFTLDESGFITTTLNKNLSEGVYLITINDNFGNVDKIKYLVK